MLRLRFLAIVFLPFIASSPLSAEAVKAEPAPSADAKPLTTAAAEPVDAHAAPAASAGAAEPAAKAAEVKKAAPAPVPASLTVQIDLSRQTMTVSEHGDAKYSWPISSGTSEFPTPRGTFRPQWSAKMWYSRKYDNAPMPHAVFINGGVAIHATPHTRHLGSPASHGCIRLAPANAATFYRLVHQHGLKATKVSVYGTPKWRAPAIARSNTDAQRARRYAVQQEDNNGFFGFFSSNSKATSAYDPGFTQQRQIRRPVRIANNGYRPQRRVVMRSYDGSRVYYVQRQGRRAYYYTNSNSGYGSNW